MPTEVFNSMFNFNEASAYPHPEEFKVMRPEYTELEEEGLWLAVINISPFRVSGRSLTKAGSRRAALYEADKTYRSYHPSYAVQNPYPEEFVDTEGKPWKRLPTNLRLKYQADYEFTLEDGDTDYASIEDMLAWDVRYQEEGQENGDD
ncbi:MAG TPA: hypothetical protein PLL64_01690 [Rhodothermales bacterium]|nr:hypothetical protein [Rhodothermales bacterium]